MISARRKDPKDETSATADTLPVDDVGDVMTMSKSSGGYEREKRKGGKRKRRNTRGNVSKDNIRTYSHAHIHNHTHAQTNICSHSFKLMYAPTETHTHTLTHGLFSIPVIASSTCISKHTLAACCTWVIFLSV